MRVEQVITGPLNSIERETFIQEINDAWTELFKLEKTAFKNIPRMRMVCQ